MLYVDVTSSCKSPMNTGVQRAVRGLFRHLQRTLGASAVMPVLWEPALRDYCRLSARERGFLEKPFAGRAGRRAREEPGRAANPVPGFSKLWRQIVHRRNRLDLARWLGAADTLFVPEIFQDGRIAWLRQFDSAAAFGVGPRRVAVFHDAIVWKQPAITPGARQAGFTDYMQVLAAFDAVVAVSREAANDLQEFWATNSIAPRASLHVLGWPAEPLAESASVSKEVETAGALEVLCVGTFEPRKNHLVLLAAAEELWRGGVAFTLVLVGRTTPTHGRQVEAKIARLRAAGRAVEWLRHVDDATLAAAYARCAFTVFPSLVEGYGLPIIESLTHGRPVLCGKNGALGELADVPASGCLVIDQTDPRAVADGLRRLLMDTPLRARLTAEARARRFPTWMDYLAALRPLLSIP